MRKFTATLPPTMAVPVERGRGSVVEQAFRFDEQPQPALDARLLERGDDRDRVGGRDEDAERDRRLPRPVGEIAQAGRDDPRGDHDAGRGEDDDDARIGAQLAPLHLQRRLENERRQQRREDQFARELDMKRETRQRDTDARQREAHRVGQVQPAREHADHRREQQQFLDPFDAQAQHHPTLAHAAPGHRDESSTPH
jgi:hypothetical protein